MPERVIEIVKLSNGDIVMRPEDEPETHLVTISFSDEVANMLQDSQLLIAQSMIQAGMTTFRNFQLDQIKAATESQLGKLH